MAAEEKDIVVTQEGKILRFDNLTTRCSVVFNKADIMDYVLLDFSCGARGGGNGLKLLRYALNYIETKVPRRERPFRMSLVVVPTSTDTTLNDYSKLLKYYEKLGFAIDEHSERMGAKGQMFVLVDILSKNVNRLLQQRAGGRKKMKYQNLY